MVRCCLGGFSWFADELLLWTPFAESFYGPGASLVAQLVKKESTCNAGDLGSIPGLGRSPGEGKRVTQELREDRVPPILCLLFANLLFQGPLGRAAPGIFSLLPPGATLECPMKS